MFTRDNIAEPRALARELADTAEQPAVEQLLVDYSGWLGGCLRQTDAAISNGIMCALMDLCPPPFDPKEEASTYLLVELHLDWELYDAEVAYAGRRCPAATCVADVSQAM